MEPEVIITERDYKKLVEAEKILDALYAGGVDNWEGYHDALQDYYKSLLDEE